jgi:hypothetical protein
MPIVDIIGLNLSIFSFIFISRSGLMDFLEEFVMRLDPGSALDLALPSSRRTQRAGVTGMRSRSMRAASRTSNESRDRFGFDRQTLSATALSSQSPIAPACHSDKQPEAMRGTALMVSVLEASSRARIGRFGWKS